VIKNNNLMRDNCLLSKDISESYREALIRSNTLRMIK